MPRTCYIFFRYQCFADLKEFEQQVQRKQPHKIDIGAVFTLPPKVWCMSIMLHASPNLSPLIFLVLCDGLIQASACPMFIQVVFL